MWYDVTIGGGNPGCTAVLLARCDGFVLSGNGSSFWIDKCGLGIGGRIFRGTEQWAKVRELLDAKADPVDIHAYVCAEFLRAASPSVILSAIERAKEEAFVRGSEARARAIRIALGID